VPPLRISQILRWADEHHARTGRWPIAGSGLVRSALGESWANISQALRLGLRSLPGGSSLARLLAEHRGVRNPAALPPLSPAKIVAWARAHQRRTGIWPIASSGRIVEAPADTWWIVDGALLSGYRSLPRGSSLARLLAERCGVRNSRRPPRLAVTHILAWADSWKRRTGAWPTGKLGAIPEMPGEKWNAVDYALRQGLRGLPAGSSLARLLSEHRGVRNHMKLPRLSPKQILAWADAWYRRTGKWPNHVSGPIPDAPGENWQAVHIAMRAGARGLTGGSTLAQLLAERRGVRNPADPPTLTTIQILAWADAHQRRTGQWPNVRSGPVVGVPSETWSAVDATLRVGRRGLQGDSSLARLLAKSRGVRNRLGTQRLDFRQIIVWAKAHRKRTGLWPTHLSGPVLESPQETWAAINGALKKGRRGLRGGSSLARLQHGASK